MADGRSANSRRANLDFAGFAQEFLRRNAAYTREYRAVVQAATGDAPPEQQEEMARRWGLCFSVRARNGTRG